MTGESPGNTTDDDALNALLERPFTELSADELMALKAAYAAHGARIYNGVPPIEVLLAAAAASYVTVFTQTLAKHNAEALIEAVRARFRRKGKTLELVIGTDDGAAAAFVVTGDLPDEARLALLDLDVTADEVRGKVLRWDDNSMRWRADNAYD